MKFIFTQLLLVVSILTVAQNQSANCECKDEGVIKDYDGNSYKTVKIGEQWWMAQNLRTTHYCDGEKIDTWVSYDDDEIIERIYGKYYNWNTATKGIMGNKNPSGVQGICPCNWHIPSDEEWKELERYLGMRKKDRDSFGNRNDETGITNRLTDPNYFNKTNSGNCTKLSLVPGGWYQEKASQRFGNWAYYMSSSKVKEKLNSFIARAFENGAEGQTKIVRNEYSSKPLSFYTIRCVKD